MGNRLIQRILECDVCGDVPEDGENMWEMCGEIWCEKCCDDDSRHTTELTEQTEKLL